MFTRTYRSVVAVNVMVTVLLVAGSKVYVADDLMVVKAEPSVLPDSDSVWLRAPQAAGSWRTGTS